MANGSPKIAALCLGASSLVGRQFGFVECEPTPGEEFEAVDSPAAGNEGQFLAAGALGQGFDRPSRLAGLEQGSGEHGSGPGRDETLIEPVRQIHALLAGLESCFDVACRERSERAIQEVPRQPLDVAGEPCRLDGTVE